MKKFLCMLVVVALILSCFTGCGSSEEVRTLNILCGKMQEPAEKIVYEKLVEMFEAETGIEVTVTYASVADAQAKVETEALSGNIVSDVVHFATSDVSALISNGWIQDMTSFSNGIDVTVTDMFDNSIVVNGVTYFVPIYYDVYISAYNVDALPYMPDGVEYTVDASGDIDQITSITWEQYVEWGINIAAAGEGAKTGFPMGTTGSQLLYPLGGIALANGSETYPLLNDEGAIEAWNQLASMSAAGAVLPEATLLEQTAPTDFLKSGDLWMSFGHMAWIGTALEANPDRYVIGPAPSGSTGKGGSTATAGILGIMEGAANTSEAEEWIEFILREDINYYMCASLGGYMSTVAEVESQIVGDSINDQIMLVGQEMLNNGMIVTGLPTELYTDWNSVKEVYTELYREILKGEEITQETADKYQEMLDALLY